MSTSTSPLMALPGAVAADGVDAAVAAHYGSFNGEQRTLASGEGFVDLSHRDVVVIAGPDRLTWLHSLTSQAFEGLAPGQWTAALVLSPQGTSSITSPVSTTGRPSPRGPSRGRASRSRAIWRR